MDAKDQIRAALISESSFSPDDFSGMCIRDNVCTIYLERNDVVLAKQTLAAKSATSVRIDGGRAFDIRYEHMQRPVIPILLPPPEAIPQAEFDRTGRWSNIPPGVSVGHTNVTAGTSSFWCDSIIHFLSNAHVLSPEGAAIGDEIVQPGALDGGTLPDDLCGTLADTGIPNYSVDEIQWDLAAARLAGGRPYMSKLLGLSSPKKVRNPELGEAVAKSGRTSAVTGALVESVDFDVVVTYKNNNPIVCKNATRYAPRFIEGGDSGSGIMALSDNAAVDVAFATGQDYSFGIGQLVEGLDFLGYNIRLLPDIEHEWVLDSESSVTVPVIERPESFEIVGHWFDPDEPFVNYPMSLYTRVRKLLDKSWIRVELLDGQQVIDSQQQHMEAEDYFVFSMRTPSTAGPWGLTMRIYTDALEGT